MAPSAYMNLNRIEFMVTYQCNGKCKHCSVGEKLNHSNSFTHVAAREAADAVETLARVFPIASVMTFGGEPLLYPDVVCTIHGRARDCGIADRQLITNGYFTKDDPKRQAVAEALAQAELTHLMLSVDAFHQETIPLDAVYAFAQYAQRSGIPNIRLHPAWVVDRSHQNPFNIKTEEILARLADLSIPVSSGNNIFMAGNATEHLSGYYDAPGFDLADSCGAMPYTQPLTNITSLSIVPNGDVMVCGFVIGNIYNENIEEIVAGYDPHDNIWMNAILSGRATGLIALAKSRGIMADASQCYSVCDLCRKIQSLHIRLLS